MTQNITELEGVLKKFYKMAQMRNNQNSVIYFFNLNSIMRTLTSKWYINKQLTQQFMKSILN